MLTSAVLKHFCSVAGVRLVSDAEAESLWVSACDPDDLPVLIRARKTANGRLVVMGGFEGYFPDPYLAWADHVVAGQGWEFVRAWGRSTDEALALPCVAHRDEGTVDPSYVIPWDIVPCARLPGSERYYYLGGVGCARKCKFCAASWCMPHFVCPSANLERVKRFVSERGRASLTLVSNDSQLPGSSTIRRPSLSVRVKDYLAVPEKYKASLLRFGIEGWTEDARAKLGKPIRDRELSSLLQTTKGRRVRSEWFFIVNYPGFQQDEFQEFCDSIISVEPANAPSLFIKTTYFDAVPHTPLAREGIGDGLVDQHALFRLLNSRNKRIRVWPTRSKQRSAFRTVFHRCSAEQAVTLGPEPKTPNTPEGYQDYVKRLARVGLSHLLGPIDWWPCSRVKTRIKRKDQTDGD